MDNTDYTNYPQVQVFDTTLAPKQISVSSALTKLAGAECGVSSLAVHAARVK